MTQFFSRFRAHGSLKEVDFPENGKVIAITSRHSNTAFSVLSTWPQTVITGSKNPALFLWSEIRGSMA
jgi:hypothetical protein